MCPSFPASFLTSPWPVSAKRSIAEHLRELLRYWRSTSAASPSGSALRAFARSVDLLRSNTQSRLRGISHGDRRHVAPGVLARK